jgi:hypothetical protein
VLDFLERLAPFSEPRLLVKDDRPFLHTLAKVETEKKEQEMDAFELLKQSLEN